MSGRFAFITFRLDGRDLFFQDCFFGGEGVLKVVGAGLVLSGGTGENKLL